MRNPYEERPPSRGGLAVTRSMRWAFVLGFVGFVAHIVAVNLPVYAEQVGIGTCRGRASHCGVRFCGDSSQARVRRAHVECQSNWHVHRDMPEPLWLQAEFTARLSLPEPIELDCIVKRVKPGRGMEVKFRDLPEAELEQLEMLVASLSEK